MNGFDWGKLIARLVAVLFVFEALNSLFEIGQLQLVDRLPIAETWMRYAMFGVRAMIAVLLWVFAGKFAPREVAVSDQAPNTNPLGAYLVAGLAAYTCLDYAYSALEKSASRIKLDPPYEPALPLVYFNIAVCLGSLVALFYSRRIAEWVVR